ncbi:MAG: tyrosine--tRNA ligase, partial [Lachnospiraceae bacterium]|nr:tyrosine--tRNA ligase [Lachnospiraceae bacterium]
KTSPFEFFQYWRNVSDADVLKCIRMLTFLPLAQIDEMDKWEGSQLNAAKEILAYELTKLVHGGEEAEKAKTASHALFAGGSDDSSMPSTKIAADRLTDGAIGILDLLDACRLSPSRSESRRLIQQGGVFADEVRVESIDAKFTAEQLKAGIKIRKGKKVFHKAYME